MPRVQQSESDPKALIAYFESLRQSFDTFFIFKQLIMRRCWAVVNDRFVEDAETTSWRDRPYIVTDDAG